MLWANLFGWPLHRVLEIQLQENVKVFKGMFRYADQGLQRTGELAQMRVGLLDGTLARELNPHPVSESCPLALPRGTLDSAQRIVFGCFRCAWDGRRQRAVEVGP